MRLTTPEDYNKKMKPAKLGIKILFRFRLSVGEVRPVIHFSKNCKKLMLVLNNKIAKIYRRVEEEHNIEVNKKEKDAENQFVYWQL